MPSIPWAFIASACSFLARSASSPPCTLGCSVLTRPSIISGKPVSSEMSETARPASRNALAVPPVEISATPWRARPLAKSTSPVLSETDSNARRMGRSVMQRLWLKELRPVLSPPPPKEKCHADAGPQRIEQRDVDMQVLAVNRDVERHGIGVHHVDDLAQHQGTEEDHDRIDEPGADGHRYSFRPTTRRMAPVSVFRSVASMLSAGAR